MSHGVAVPEADRQVHSKPIHHNKKLAIPGIPIIGEDGTAVGEENGPS